MRAELPSGTVTFLFTDVEGSTKLLHELGAEAYADALAEHRGVIREACAAEHGVEVDTQGDAFFFAFPTAPGALAAASALTEALASGQVQVRVGLHTGTPLLTDEGYVGDDVHRAARIAACGHGGQVLVSSSTVQLVETELRDLGEHRLKDLSAPERVYQLGDGDFPALKSLYRTNLPVPATPFLGRETELRDVLSLLHAADTRLLTLTGPGGTGKTRLALQAAAESADRYPDGVWWVPLAAAREPSLLLPAIAQAVGVPERPGTEIDAAIVAGLTGKSTLILVDNVEHLLPEAASHLGGLLTAPGVRLLLTSRERLRLQAERVYPVPPLDEADGISLFASRARAIDPAFAADASVAELCGRLDNLPLALELAAARTSLFPPEQLLGRLTKRLDVLKGSRDLDPRQQTLRATLEWSHDLLTPEEQALFRSLSVFAGGCTFEAAEEICGADPDTLESLLDKSLLRRRDSEIGPRYWMLETIREFATERLPESERVTLRDAQLEYFVDALGRLGWAARRRDPAALAFLRVEQANVLAALNRALETRAVEAAQRLVIGAWFQWVTGGLAAEADAWASAVAELPGEPSLEYSHTLAIAGEFPRFRGEPERALPLKRRTLEVLAQLDPDDPEIRRFTAASHTDIADVYSQLGETERAERHVEHALAIRRDLGDAAGVAHALASVGLIAERRGAYEEAASAYSEAAELLDGAGERFEAAGSLCSLGLNLHRLGDYAGARAALDEAMQRGLDSGDRIDVVFARAGLGLLAASEGAPAEAVELLSRARAELSDLSLVFDIEDEIDAALERCRNQIGEDAYLTAIEFGAALAKSGAG